MSGYISFNCSQQNMTYTLTGLRERHILSQWQMDKTELPDLPSDANILADLPGVKVFSQNFIRIKETM